MKNLLTIVLATATMGLYAQNANVVSAYNEMKDGNLAKAAEYIEPAISDPKTSVSEKTWRYRGDIYRLIALGEDAALKQQFPEAIDRAIESYLKANELDTKGSYKLENGRALRAMQGASLNAGNDAFGAKDYDKAIACYGQSEKVAKSFGEADTNAVFNSALAYESKGDAANAIKRYQEALAIGYNKPEIYRYISGLQRKTEDNEGALTTIRGGRAKFPDNKDLIMDEMTLLLALDRADEAEGSVKLAIEKDPNNALLYSVLGGLYNNRAANEYEKCNKLKSDTEYVKCKKVADDIYLQAVPYFEGAHRLDPKDQQTIQQLMKLYAKTNDQAKYQEMKDKLGK